MIRHDAEALTLYSELVTAKPHIHKDDSDNVTIINDGRGNAKPYALRKLHKVGLLLIWYMLRCSDY